MKGIPTEHKYRRFRSRLEAKWNWGHIWQLDKK